MASAELAHSRNSEQQQVQQEQEQEQSSQPNHSLHQGAAQHHHHHHRHHHHQQQQQQQSQSHHLQQSSSSSSQQNHHHHHHHLQQHNAVGATHSDTLNSSSSSNEAAGQQQSAHHHHHHKVHHHHHYHHQSPPSSPFPPSRTDSPAFGMNKSSAPASPGTGTGSSGAAPPAPSSSSAQVISRTGRAAGPSISTSFQASTAAAARGADSAASTGRSALNGHGSSTNTAQIHQHGSTSAHQQQSSGQSAHSATALNNHHHHHHLHQQPHSSAPPASTTMNGLPAGFGGPITVAEALSNVNNQAGPSSHSSNTAPPAWSSSSSSAMANPSGPVASGHPSSAIAAGPSTHPSQVPHGPGVGPSNAHEQHNTMIEGPLVPGGISRHSVPAHAAAVAGGGGGGATTEAHHLSLRGVIEYGTILNNEAAKELNYNIETKKNLPKILKNLESETESCYSEIGLIAWNLNDYKKAFKFFEGSLLKNPFCLVSLQGLARFYHEKASGNSDIANFVDSSNSTSASASAANAITNGSNTNGTITNAQQAGSGTTGIVNVEDCYNKVVDYASRALAIDDTGNEGEMWSLIGHAFLQLGQMPRAYSCYQQAIAKAVKKDDPKLWYGIGILYDRYGSVEHAEEAFASVLKLDPNFHKREEVFFRLGIIYKLQGKADASLECFHYILARPPEPLKAVDVWYQIGHAHELKRDLTLAKEAYERVLKTTPDHSKVLQHLGGLYLREDTSFHNPQKCIDYISQSLEHDSTDPFSWYLLGRAFMQQNNYGKAYEAYQQAVYRDGKNPAYWCSIGVLYFNINQYHDALDAYTRAVRIHPFIPEIWQNLGILYESCHDQLADATDAYQRASQLDRKNVELERRLKEVRNALRTGSEITTVPPPPQDIMPDSSSWQAVHMDVSGAKPVYLDSKTISQHPSPTPETGLGFSNPVQSRPSHRGSPPPPGSIVPPAAYATGGPQDIINGRRRSSFTRPDSSHAHHAPPYPGQYPDDAARSRHPGQGLSGSQLLGGQHGLAMASRPAPRSLASTPSGQHDMDRDGLHGPPRAGAPPSRVAGSSNRSSAYPSERHSPHTMHDPGFRHAISPSNSPRMRAAEYDYQMRAAAAAQTGSGGDAIYERERQMREAEREREDQRAGSRSGLHHQQQQQRRHPPPPPIATGHSPTDTRTSSAYGHRDYPAGASRRPGSPPLGPGPRHPDERPAPARAANGSSRPPGYPYEYYPNGPPGYPDPRRDPRYVHDPRYDYADIAAVERERIQAERERQARRPPPLSIGPEEDERRRREIERNGPVGSQIRNGRRDMSPGELLDARERERDLRRPPPINDGPGSLPSMRTAAPPRGPGGHYPPHADQGRSSFDNGQKAAADRRKQYRHPEDGPQSQDPSRQVDQNFDDETDMANALIGLAGGAPGTEGPSPGQSGPYRAGEKRPLSAHEDAPFKKARGQEDAAM